MCHKFICVKCFKSTWWVGGPAAALAAAALPPPPSPPLPLPVSGFVQSEPQALSSCCRVGCGQHIDAALAGVPEDARCHCKPWTQAQQNAANGGASCCLQ